MYEEVAQYASLGFSFLMCGWFMYRMEQRMKESTDALMMIAGVIQRCKKTEVS